MKLYGRNDPCPCGSGKKFKKCCLAKYTGGPPPVNPADPPDLRLRYRIRDFVDARDPRGETLKAAHREWEGEFPERALDQYDKSDATTLMDYIVHDRIADGESKTNLELFHEQEGAGLPDEERIILEGWLDNRRAFYEVLAVRPEEGGDLRDLLTGREYRVFDKSFSRTANKWDLLWLRLLPQEGAYEITGTGQPIHRRLKAELERRLREMLKDYQARFPGTSLEDFLKRSTCAVRRMIFDLHEENRPEFHTSTGEAMTPTDAFFEVRNAPEVRARLRAMKDFEDLGEDSEKPETMFNWLQRGPSARLFPAQSPKSGISFMARLTGKGRKPAVLLGSLVLDAKELRATCFSQERMDVLVRLLETRLGDLVKFIRTKRTPLDAVVSTAREAAPAAPPSAAIPPDIKDRLIRDYYEKYYREWLDLPVPALQGLTPRQAAADPAKRGELEELLRYMENMEGEEIRRGEPAYGMHRLRKALGV